ncbi:MAG: acriflavin resistance protein [Planctomycetaceae bacterium]|nr:acriflavin resistance protein [Planctomycetaceae bacterium]
MHLIESFIRNPVKVSVGVLLAAIFGGISLASIPKQLTPDVQNPVLSIETRWPGASPQEIEREIVQEQEEQLQSTEGLVKLTSECRDSEARITMEFAVGTNIEDAMLRVNTRLQQVREYPIDALEPVIRASDSADRPIARFVLTARPPTIERIEAFTREHPDTRPLLQHAMSAMTTGLRVYRLQTVWRDHGDQYPELAQLLPPELDLQEMRKFSEDVIETYLERVPGVADAYTYGGQQEELQVIVDPEQLAARELTVPDVRDALRSQNKDTSGGDLWEGKRRWVVRTLGQFRNPEQVERQILAVRDGVPVYVRDVAEVKVGFKKIDSISRRYGISSNGLGVRRASGANVLEVMKGIRAAAQELNDGILKQRGVEIFQYYDETEYITSAMSLVQQNIFVGGALTMIVLLLFLHLGQRTLVIAPLIAASAVASTVVSPWFVLVTLVLVVTAGFWFGRGALVVGLAIPVSIIGTFLLLRLMGRSLNVISLAGLAFAVGMLVDNAVVVLENVYRHYQRGDAPFEAAARGTKEVWGAVIASTLTTIAVFLPVLFVQETSGQLFRDIALAISCAVGLSMVVSFTVIPTAAARLFPRRLVTAPNRGQSDSHHVPRSSGLIPRMLTTFGSAFVDAITGLNRWIQRGSMRSLGVILLLVGLSVGLSWLFWPKVEYLPSGNRNFVFCSVSPPPGYNMDQLIAMGETIEQDLEPYWNADRGSEAAAKLDAPIINYYFYVVRGRRVFMGFRSDDHSRVRELIPMVKQTASQFPGTIAVVKQSSLFERGLTGGRTIDIEITGPTLEQLVKIGGRVLAEVKRLMPDAQAMPRPSLDLSSPEIHVEPKLVEASEMGVTAAELGYTVNALVDGAYVGDYFTGGDKIDLTIIGNETFAKQTQDLESLPIVTTTGQLVPLGAVANVRLSSGPEQINRRERLRAITIQVTPPLATPLEEAMHQVDSEIIAPLFKSGALDGGYLVTLSGTADKLREAWSVVRWNLLLALAITYLLMAALFESWLYPFVVIFSVPLGAVGGILGLTILNLFVLQSLDVLTMLGFVILIGTVVNNAILIVHQSLNHMRDEHLAPPEAITESIRTRIRPIFVTTLTTVLGLLPLVVFRGAGSELYRGLGSVVLGGLIVSTVFTLVLVPTVFLLTLRTKHWLARLLGLAPGLAAAKNALPLLTGDEELGQISRPA